MWRLCGKFVYIGQRNKNSDCTMMYTLIQCTWVWVMYVNLRFCVTKMTKWWNSFQTAIEWCWCRIIITKICCLVQIRINISRNLMINRWGRGEHLKNCLFTSVFFVVGVINEGCELLLTLTLLIAVNYLAWFSSISRGLFCKKKVFFWRKNWLTWEVRLISS